MGFEWNTRVRTCRTSPSGVAGPRIPRLSNMTQCARLRACVRACGADHWPRRSCNNTANNTTGWLNAPYTGLGRAHTALRHTQQHANQRKSKTGQTGRRFSHARRRVPVCGGVPIWSKHHSARVPPRHSLVHDDAAAAADSNAIGVGNKSYVLLCSEFLPIINLVQHYIISNVRSRGRRSHAQAARMICAPAICVCARRGSAVVTPVVTPTHNIIQTQQTLQ